MVAGPVTNVFSNDAILGSSIYNSSFVPAVKYVFPDLTVQQIAKLDDMGFSAGASTMLIPKSGAISFVAFIPADSFLVPKLAQYEQLLATDDQSQQRIEECSKLQDKQAAIAAKSDEKSRSTSPPQLTAAESQTLSECDELLAPKSTASVPMLSSKTVRSAKGNSTHVGLSSWFTLGMHTSRKTIGSFDPAVVLLLQRDLHILASGSHIQQLTAQLVINSVTCSMPDPLVSDSTVSCALTGNGLNQVTQGRLISQSDSTVSVPSTGLKSTKDDPTHAQLSFPACSFLGKPQGNYLLEISSSSSGTQLYPSAQELKPNGFTCNREAGGVTCHVPSTLAATSITLTGSDKKPNTFTPAGGLVSPQMLASGTYDAAATVSGKAVQLCPVTF